MASDHWEIRRTDGTVDSSGYVGRDHAVSALDELESGDRPLSYYLVDKVTGNRSVSFAGKTRLMQLGKSEVAYFSELDEMQRKLPESGVAGPSMVRLLMEKDADYRGEFNVTSATAAHLVSLGLICPATDDTSQTTYYAAGPDSWLAWASVDGAILDYRIQELAGLGFPAVDCDDPHVEYDHLVHVLGGSSEPLHVHVGERGIRVHQEIHDASVDDEDLVDDRELTFATVEGFRQWLSAEDLVLPEAFLRTLERGTLPAPPGDMRIAWEPNVADLEKLDEVMREVRHAMSTPGESHEIFAGSYCLLGHWQSVDQEERARANALFDQCRHAALNEAVANGIPQTYRVDRVEFVDDDGFKTLDGYQVVELSDDGGVCGVVSGTLHASQAAAQQELAEITAGPNLSAPPVETPDVSVMLEQAISSGLLSVEAVFDAQKHEALDSFARWVQTSGQNRGPDAPADPAAAALSDLVGVLLRADKEGGIWQALYNEGITDSYDQALEGALRALGNRGIADVAHRYELDPAALLERIAGRQSHEESSASVDESTRFRVRM